MLNSFVNNFRKVLAIALSSFFFLGLGLSLGFLIGSKQPARFYNQKANVCSEQNQNTSRQSSTKSYSQAIKKSRKAVVNVFSEKKIQRSLSGLELLFEDFFQERFPREKIFKGEGSGVLISADGYLLTNNHVVQGASQIRVTLHNNQELSAKIVGTDSKTDLALLKINSKQKSWDFIEFADSDQAQIGDVVLAIGNPFGLGQTVTMGIISATGRENLGILDYEEFIQTDAAINPGNSGGALINTKGKLLGINAAIYSKSGGSEGLGFAIPANLAFKISNDLRDYGKVRRPYLGIEVINLNDHRIYKLAEFFKNKNIEEGVIITNISEDSPLKKFGIKKFSLIKAINSKQIKAYSDLLKVLYRPSRQKKIKLEIISFNPENQKIKAKQIYFEPEIR